MIVDTISQIRSMNEFGLNYSNHNHQMWFQLLVSWILQSKVFMKDLWILKDIRQEKRNSEQSHIICEGNGEVIYKCGYFSNLYGAFWVRKWGWGQNKTTQVVYNEDNIILVERFMDLDFDKILSKLDFNWNCVSEDTKPEKGCIVRP